KRSHAGCSRQGSGLRIFWRNRGDTLDWTQSLVLPRPGGRMDHPEIHKAQVLTPPTHMHTPAEHRDSPIFIPALKHQPVKLVRRGLRSRRRQMIAVAVLGLLLIGSFA